MVSKLSRSLAISGLFTLALAGSACAQGFQAGNFYGGPRIWVGNLNGAVAIGAQVEKGFTKPGDYGPGIIAGGLGIDWYSWSYNYQPFGSYDYTVVPVQVFGNYHFVLPRTPEWDPYVGLALVYSHVNASWSGPGVGVVSASGSGTDFAGEAGLRYFFSEKFAVQGQVGFGYGSLGLGATWRF